MRQSLGVLCVVCAVACFPRMARSQEFVDTGRLRSNRVDYGASSRGVIGAEGCCTHSAPGSWPRGSFDQYLFGSGVQVAGVIGGSRATNPWAGDTAAGFFYDPSGFRQHGTGLTAVGNAGFAATLPDWPQAGFLPYGSEGMLFADALRGRASAGDADAWWVSWEGDSRYAAARPHPLGIVAEHRVMGWNAPRGNEDILYVMVTFYNITARGAAAYASYRPGMRELLATQAEEFHRRAGEEHAVVLPEGGYAIEPFYAAIAADPDVSPTAGINFASVNLPLAMAFTWHADFVRPAGWVFPADLFSAPFAPRAGLVGIAMLRNLSGDPRLGFYTGTTNGGAVPDANSAARAFRYFKGEIGVATGEQCNHGDPVVTRICHVPTVPSDVRTLQASPPVSLPPGGAVTLVFAYVHAAPVAVASAPSGVRVAPGDPLRLTRPADLVAGANLVDSIAGFTGFADDNGNGQVDGRELRAVPRSLIAKAQLAQAFFAHGFQSPAAPEPPSFFLVPGDRAVTVVWQPSPTDRVGDPYYAVAREATMVPAGGGAPVANPLYDPNYRQFDVEGYRIWRGRTDAPEALELVVQFDHNSTRFADYTGQVSTSYLGWGRCAPELGITADCDGVFDAPVAGVAPTRYVNHDIAGTLTQVATGDRVVLPNGEISLLAADSVAFPTQVLGVYSNSGVPYVWRDATVRNGLTYFYAVTAFDVNAINSTGRGRTSLESARQTRRVVPQVGASNIRTRWAMRTYLRGRSGELTDTVRPVLDAESGRFDKRFPVGDGLRLQPLPPVTELLAGALEARLRLDSARVVSLVEQGSGIQVSVEQHFTVTASDGATARVLLPLTLRDGGSASWHGYDLPPMLMGDPDLVARHRGAGAAGSTATLSVQWPPLAFLTMPGRGCYGSFLFGTQSACHYNGPRWFSGTNESRRDPNGANAGTFHGGIPTDHNNAGELLGVRTIFHPQAYEMVPSTWRRVEAVLGAFAGGADYRVHWGSGGVIDSVIDLTYDVPVPFATTMGLSWGVLNPDAVPASGAYDQRSALTYTDATCVEPLRSVPLVQAIVECTAPAVPLERVARPGPVAFGAGNSFAMSRTAPVAPGTGFLLYIRGRLFQLELSGGMPAAATRWTMRDYVGAITGGRGAAGDDGPYRYVLPDYSSVPVNAPGVEVVVEVTGERSVVAGAEVDLTRVHTVPDPYYQPADGGGGEAPAGVTFVNLPTAATIRIYSSSGVLVRVLEHRSPTDGGEVTWDLRSRGNRRVASGVYLYHVAVPEGATAVGRMTVVQ